MYLILEEFLGLTRIAAIGNYPEMVKQFADLKPNGKYKYVLVKVEQVTDWKTAKI